MKNTSAHPIEIERFESTCDCLRTKPVSLRLESGDQAVVCVQLVLSDATEFVGTLVIDVAGKSKGEEDIFSLRAFADVRPINDFAAFGETEAAQTPQTTIPVPVPMP